MPATSPSPAPNNAQLPQGAALKRCRQNLLLIMTAVAVAVSGITLWLPFISTRLVTFACAALVILVGAVTFWRITNPIIRRLAESDEQQRDILSAVQDIVYRTVISSQGKGLELEYVSDQVSSILGHRAQDFLEDPAYWPRIIHPDDIPALETSSREMLARGTPVVREFRVRHKHSGAYVWIEDKTTPRRDATGKIIGTFGVARDITARKHAEAKLSMLSGALEQTADAVMITDRESTVEYVNPAFEEMTGYSSSEALGKKANLVKSFMQSPEFYERLWSTILAGDVFKDVFVNRRKDGSLYFEEKTISPLKDAAGHLTHFIATGQDISERVAAQERLQFLAHHDPLTALPNRALFLDRLKQAMALGRRYNRLVAVLFLDLDNFKTINDHLGHQVGDDLLQAVAERLGKCVRERDTVARFGGDEFAIILEEVAAVEDISPIAEKILETLGRPFAVETSGLAVTTSIGISLFPHDGSDYQTLLKHADAAMYRAKQQGRNTYQFYTPSYVARGLPRVSLETNLRLALERNEFFVCYQAQVDAHTEQVVGAESLLRWNHPEMGEILPERFIALLEDSGLILAVEEWVLHTVCTQLQSWRAQGLPPLEVAVNLSAHQFQRKDLVDTVKRVLNDTALPPHSLKLEITESVLLHHSEGTLTTLRTLHEMGVELCIDDFGTGYSALGYLKKFPMNSLKLDRSFTHDITTDSDSAAITSAIIAMAHALRLTVIAEGAETAEQARILREQGCDQIQGFYYSKPLTADAFARWVQARQAA